jgi:cytochrome P450
VALTGQRPAHLSRGLADGSGAYLTACLQETMRLWPTTPLLSRETRTAIDWNGTEIPAGTLVLIVTAHSHRDPDRIPFADSFAPRQWIDEDAANRLPFTQFSRGPQVCPGIELALLVGRTVLRVALEHTVAVASPKLSEDGPLPHMLDFFAVRVVVA